MKDEVVTLRQRVAELESANAEARAKLRYVDALERVSRAGNRAGGVDAFLEALLDELLAIFECDRAWLLYPCDPDAASWGVPMERNVPEWPGVFALGVEVPMDDSVAVVFRDALAAEGALPYDSTTERQVPNEIAQAFGVRSQLLATLRPRTGKPWLIGLHHCSRDHVWTESEIKTFSAITRRVADVLDSKLLLRELRESERQVAELQRADAIGSLAGGIAHDFNNQLLVILCYADLLREKLEREEEDIALIISAAETASDLTGQLLTFSRRAVLDPRHVDIAGLVRNREPILQSAVGQSVELTVEAQDYPVVVLADPAGLEQVVLNLVLNARDALGAGGKVTVRCLEGTTDELDSPPRDLPAGDRWVVLQVEDDGPGMNEDVLRQVFEPFFTTKQHGKGTGLGLSTASGFVQQSGGAITVTSEPGRGACFSAWLPASEEAPAPTLSAISASGAESLGGYVLVVEPHPEARQVARHILTAAGFTVDAVADGSAALRLLRARDDIEVLLSEVALPDMDGVDLAADALATRPELRVSFATGYSHHTAERLRRAGATRRLLQKPYNPDALVRHVEWVLTGSQTALTEE